MLFLKYILFVAVICYIGLCIYFLAKQRALIFCPNPNPPIATPLSVGLPFHEGILDMGNGNIHYWDIPPSQEGLPTILYCHGNAGNLESSLEHLKLLYKTGLGIFIFDYRGYGKSAAPAKGISEESVYEDAFAVYEHLINQKGLTNKKIIIFGRSLGGGVAVELAREVNPLGLILDSTFTSLPDVGAKLYPYIPVHIIVRHRFDNYNKLPAVYTPILIIHSQEDELIPLDQAYKNFKVANYPKEICILSRGTHNDSYSAEPERYVKAIMEFVSKLPLSSPR